MTVNSFDWVRRIQSAIQELDEKPQFGLPFPFSLGAFTNRLKEIFGISNLNIQLEEMRWLLQDQVFEGIANRQQIQTTGVIFSPLPTQIAWAMSEHDLKQLITEILNVEPEKKLFLEDEIVKGFNEFISVQIVDLVSRFGNSADLTPQITPLDSDHFFQSFKAYFRIDVSIKINDKAVWAFILIPDQFRNEWKKHFSEKKLHTELDPNTARNLLVDVALEAGNGELTFDDCKKLSLGDFIILDRCLIDPEENSGRLLLTINGNPIFRAKIKQEGLKLLEYPLFELSRGSMVSDSEDENDLDDEDLDEVEDFDEEEDDLEDLPENKVEEKNSVQENQTETFSLKNVPMTVTIEVGRIKMTALELMNLQPGNLIDLQISPAQGVDIIINGKKIGRGELIKMDDVLGVRVLQL